MIFTPGEKDATSSTLHAPPAHCRNCGHEVRHNYCPKCGQHVKDSNHNLWQFVAEFMEEFVRLDSKFLRTLIPLTVKPGYLTKEWVEGKRVRYITPLKLYISLSAIFFLILSLHPNTNIIQTSQTDDDSLKVAQQEIQKKKEKSRSGFDAIVNDQVSKLLVEGPEGKARRKQFGEQLIGRLSTANLILLPIFALLFKFLYIRRSRFYVEHLVFALHVYAFYSLMFSGVLLVTLLKAPYSLLAFPLVLWMGAYLPIAMFVNYCQGFLKTMIKCIIFGMIYVGAVSFVMLGMIVWTAYELPSAPKPAAISTDHPSNSAPSKPATTPISTQKSQ